MTRRLRLLVALLIGSVALTGCDFDVYQLPLPGGTAVGDDPISVTIYFDDVLDLVPKSTVKVNDVSVGQITDIELGHGPDGDEGFQAKVTVELRNDTALPANAVANIRQTSLLGEKFVSLGPPTAEAPTGTLADDAVILNADTGANPEIEEVLAALSLVLNGGGVAQLRTISREVNKALEGREDSTRSVLTQIAQLMSQLDDNKGDIVDAIESLNRLAISVKRQQPSIDAALDELPSALVSLDKQRDDLIDMLQALDRLSDVGVRVITRSKDATIESLRQLQPVLTNLADSGDDLVNSFNVILTYPFVDEVVGRDPQVARNIHLGDYTNLSVRLDLDLTDLPDIPGIGCTPLNAIPEGLPIDLESLCEGAQNAIAPCLNNPSLATCADLPGAVIGAVCASIDIPLPVLCPGSGGGGGGGGGLGLGGGGGGGGGVIPGLPGIPGLGGLLGRTAPGTVIGRGPTYATLMKLYNPALVTLMTPGMVLR